LTPKTKLLVYSYGDAIIMKKLELPDMKSSWKNSGERWIGSWHIS
jgi:hypothetical protein